jgi:adenylate cyclase
MLERADRPRIALVSSTRRWNRKVFSLKLLGGAVIEGPQGPLGGRASQRRRVALLSVLALARDRPLSRDKLLAIFWPESESDRARHNLADSLYLIRKDLGENAILQAGDELWLNTEVIHSDVAVFETAIQGGDLKSAVAAYAGPLLDGFHISDAPDFERWLDVERERLKRACANALEQLADEATVRGDWNSAIDRLRRLGGLDPYNSAVVLRLMEALEAAGDRTGAIHQARIHTAMLEQDFGIEPDGRVAALAERIRSAPVVPHSASEMHAPRPQEPAASGMLAGAEDPILPTGSVVTPTKPRILTRKFIAPVGVALAGVAVVLWVGWLLPSLSGRASLANDDPVASTKTIAVLPFNNLNGDSEQDYFSDGLTDELIGVLSQVRALRVVARTSAFAFKGENLDIREIGRALSVGAVLEGSVRREGERIRVTAQLINAADGFHLWSDTYEREGTDIFAIQSDLALRIARALEAELTPAERERIARRRTGNPEAHALYLKGRYFWNQRSEAGFVRAIEYFERAIEADPQYAAAYAGLATAYALQGLSGNLTPREARGRVREAAMKAIEIDDRLAEAHTALGAYLHVYEWDWQAAEREHRRAIELDPNSSMARQIYGAELTAMGRLEEAVAQRRKAVELDPLAPLFSESLGSTLLRAGRSEEALVHLRAALELDSTYSRAHATLGDLYVSKGRFEDAVAAHHRSVELTGANSNAQAGLARALALAGRQDEARRIFTQLQAEAERTGLHSPALATVFLALNDVEGALAWLELSYQERHPQLRFIGGLRYARLENDPRFLDLLRRIGLRR